MLVYKTTLKIVLFKLLSGSRDELVIRCILLCMTIILNVVFEVLSLRVLLFNLRKHFKCATQVNFIHVSGN